MKTISIHEVQATLAAGARYVDVRSVPEFDGGHPPSAVNVPLQEADEDSGVLVTNPDFIRVMRAAFPPDTPLVVGCQSGGRSARAARMLEVFGFVDVAHVAGGIVAWLEAGLSVEDDPSGYPALLRAADALED